MKFIGTPATKTWIENDMLHGEWSDLSCDDDERYTNSEIIITRSVPLTDDMEDRLEEALDRAFDDWVRETRNQ